MCKRFVYLLLLVMLSLFLVSGCSSKTTEQTGADQVTITDMVGREVSVGSQPAERIVAIGPGALRLCCYVDGIKKVVGVEQIEIDNPMGRPYFYAFPELKDLPVIGPGGPNNVPDPEKILAVQPDVIFSTYTTEKASIDELQDKTGIPVIALSYGKVSVFDEDVNKSLELIGKVVGEEEKAQKVISYIEECKQDLDRRTKQIPDNQKPSVYIGALSFKGTHGIESTQGDYSLFKAVNAKNVAERIKQEGSVMIDKEKLLEWDPDIIFIDLAGYQMVREDYRKNEKFYYTLSAVREGGLYSQLPYNFYSTNIGTAIANAYYLGKVLYPEQFQDIDPEEKADEIYQALLGKKLYSRVAEDYGGFGKLELQ
ncbi:MAG: iron ABC transporter substrate-binding protein [Bacillota bacterium]|jgi:iron complex transport system substrate-binding protein